jgi:putative flippase GtrA
MSVPPIETGMRWLRFNLVGAIGVILQLALLTMLTHVAGIGSLTATMVAVECAIVHNFLWHQRFTWADRRTRQARLQIVRFMKFNVSNGGVSLLGNVALMQFLAGQAHMPAVTANGIAILCCSLINFAIGDRFVFRRYPV